MRSTTARRIVPETIQTSAMDCGPAALRSLLAGFDVQVGYGGLREACRTDVDGTSIDALEVAATSRSVTTVACCPGVKRSAYGWRAPWPRTASGWSSSTRHCAAWTAASAPGCWSSPGSTGQP